MNIINAIKNNLYQISAITEKNIKILLRFKYAVLFAFILSPLISVLMPLIIMGQFFEFNDQFGPWNKSNYMVYIFIAFNIIILQGLILTFQNQFSVEKFWRTLPALMIAPFNRFNLLLGIFCSHIVVSSIPFSVFFIICYIYYPISFLTVIFVFFLYLLIALIFSGIGLILGIFVITNENISQMLSFVINLVIFTSCISFPYEIFPDLLQKIINLNPLYYSFNILRLSWIENDISTTLSLHFFSFLILILLSVFLPTIAIILFNKIFKKYGITGY